ACHTAIRSRASRGWLTSRLRLFRRLPMLLFFFFFSSRRRHTRSVSAFLLNRSSDLISRRNIRRRITIPLTLSNLKLLRRITRTENILHRNFTRRQVAIQNRVASNIGISQSTFSVKVLNLFSRSRRKTNKR